MTFEHYKTKELTWSRTFYDDGHTWICEEWVCNEYPDLRCRVHYKRGQKNQFHQFMLRGDHGTRHASLKKAFKALRKRKAIRRGTRGTNKIQPGRSSTRNRKARRT